MPRSGAQRTRSCTRGRCRRHPARGQRIEREFDRDAVRRLKQDAATDIAIGGPELASHAIDAGLVDECHLFLCPIVVGGGKHALHDNVRAQLELLAERRFGNGVVHLHYRVL